MNKKNEDLLHSIQRMEEKIKNLTRENVEMVSRWPWGPPAPSSGLRLGLSSPNPSSPCSPCSPCLLQEAHEGSQPTPTPVLPLLWDPQGSGSVPGGRTPGSTPQLGLYLHPAACRPVASDAPRILPAPQCLHPESGGGNTSTGGCLEDRVVAEKGLPAYLAPGHAY